MLLQQYHQVDENIWNVIKYILVAFGAILVWQAKRIVDSNDRLADAVQYLKEDIHQIRTNSDNTSKKLDSVVEEVEGIKTHLSDHNGRIIKLETKLEDSGFPASHIRN